MGTLINFVDRVARASIAALGGVYASLAGSASQSFASNGLSISGLVATPRVLKYQTAGVDRWRLTVNAAGEIGANAGSDFNLNRYTDAGDFLGYALTITRANGDIGIPGTLTLNGVSSALGFGTGAGGTVTQATSKSTMVTLHKSCGTITMHNETLAGGATVSFQLANSLVGVNDVVVPNVVWNGVGNPIDYSVRAASLQTSPATVLIVVTNETGGPLSAAIGINFVIIKGSIG